MADNHTRPVSRVKPATLFSAVAIGAVTATTIVVGNPANADEDYPTWSEVQQAKQSEAAKLAEIAKLTELLNGLRAAAEAASRESLIAAEAYRIADEAHQAAITRESSLASQADDAEKRAETSRMRAGLLAAHLARKTGDELSLELFLKGAGASEVLRGLGTATKIGEQSQAAYEQAEQDKNAAESLRGQAEKASSERARLADEARGSYDAAKSAEDAARTAVAVEEEHSATMYAQLAELKDTTAELEREYAEGERARQEAAQPPGGGNAGGGTGGGGGNSGGGSGGGGGAPAPAPAPGPAPGPPNGSAVDTALAFARAQLGKPYRLGGAGPDSWDCSGLTRAAYAAAGISIGTHSATNQFYTMENQGKLVPFDQAQPGDLVFWGGGGSYYHVALYIGGGRILEAPDWGKPVREYYIWGMGDVSPWVGRPSG
ncbi:C40 family peptidase [Agromyces atrinae]|uniref:Cell wall-associated NlpC family hydrolase n=1 Tax=Agromyces atrinae TaxID=592376 RepID=A0A4Q2M032_9MICO|nr:C40 family peptidase [Agromyces atrinae]NYD68440.1 cell wall-associated NlpC family hydrolase [Agromyces atrinae]RXZ85184.1 NlpC/P60 family protein [Agromyces atrinae]